MNWIDRAVEENNKIKGLRSFEDFHKELVNTIMLRKDCQFRNNKTKRLIVQSGKAKDFRSPNFIKFGI